MSRDRSRRSTPGTTATPAETAKRLVESGLLDRDWVGRQLGTTFGSDQDAARAVVAGQPSVSPHPLVELGRAGVGGHGADELAEFLRRKLERATVRPHPMVDLDRIRRELGAPAAEEHPGGPLGAWLEQATDDSPLPVPSGLPEITLGEFRAHAAAALEEFLVQDALVHAPRTVATLADEVLDPRPPAVGSGGTNGANGAGVSRPRVSVLLPTWNRAPVLRRAVASVQAQTFGDWELVVVDDGSDDDTTGVLAGLAAFDPRIVVVRVPHGGVARARNEGLARARGEYVAFLDSDSAWTPGFLAAVVGRLVESGGPMAHAAVRVPGSGGSGGSGEPAYAAFGGTHEHLLAGARLELDTLVVRREVLVALGGFDEALRRGVDLDLVLRLAAEHPLRLVPFVGIDRTASQDAGGPTGAPRIRDTEPDTWASVVLSRHLVARAPAPPATTPGRTTVVLAAGADLAGAVAWIEAVLATSSGADAETGALELVVLGGRGSRADHVVARTLAHLSTRIRFLASAADVGPAVSLTLGARAATGERLVLVRAGVEPDPVTATALGRTLDDPGLTLVQPLVLGSDDTVLAAGAVFAPGSVRPEVFLEGHPTRDVPDGPLVDLPSALGPVLALRTETLLSLEGLDPLHDQGLPEVALGLRVAAADAGRVALAPALRMRTQLAEAAGPARLDLAIRLLEGAGAASPPGSEALWASAGFDVLGHRNEPVRLHGAGRFDPPPTEQVLLRPRAVLLPSPPRSARLLEHPPRLRWTIDTSAPAGPRGLGRTEALVARSLADALERLGQRVSVDGRQARHRSSRDHDDVVLVLRDADAVDPRPGAVNVVWVRSHPEQVTRAELAPYDLVYAASSPWAAGRSEAWALDVRPLLASTDPSVFAPADQPPPDPGVPPVLFTGDAGGVYRSSLRGAVAAGVDVAVYGTGWPVFLPRRLVAANRIDDRGRAALYATAGIVLADHPEDLRRHGFLGSGVLDAAACAARIVCDDVPGATELLGACVRTFRADDEVAALVTDPAAFGSWTDRRAVAARIATEHSVDRRAATLLAAVAPLVSSRG